MTGPTFEPLPDGAIIVRGVPLDELRRRVVRRRPGRPNGPEITEAAVRRAVAELCEFNVEWTRLNLATALDTSTKRLCPAVDRVFGSWAKLTEFRRAWHQYGGTHEDHRDSA